MKLCPRSWAVGVANDKADVISRAGETLARGKIEAVKVIEETVDDGSGESREKVVFNKSRDASAKPKGSSSKKKKYRRGFADLMIMITLGIFATAAGIGWLICAS